MRALAFGLFVFALGALTGCGGGAKYVPVSGTVTVNGKPVANLMVTFQPIGGTGGDAGGVGSFATTGPDGSFVLEVMTQAPQPGALVGKHRVRIATPPPKGNTTSDSAAGDRKKLFTDPIPPHYNVESTLEFDVPAVGTSAADFALTAPKN